MPSEPQSPDRALDSDQTLEELKKLREGRGLRADRLTASPNVLAATGTTDGVEGVHLLTQILDQLGDSEKLRALRVDFGIDLAELLQRKPTPRELDFLGDRRATYGSIIGRDPKTLSRWSNAAIVELRAQLINDQFDGNVLVMAGVQNRRLTGIDIRRYTDDNELRHGLNTVYENPEDSSLPLVLFGFPRTWNPTKLNFMIAFIGSDLPERVWAIVAESVIDVSFGHKRTQLEIDQNGITRCVIENPRFEQLYGVWWEW